MSLLIHTSSYQGREALVLACDNRTLEWLDQSFGALAQNDTEGQSGFVVGNQRRIRSRQGVAIYFKPTEVSSASRITGDNGHFTWYVSGDLARRFQGLVRGLKASTNPGHQYLEGDDPRSPMLVLSKGEYEENALMAMGEE